MKKIRKYSWKDYDKDINNLVRRIKYANFQPKTLVGLARGGLVPGVTLSHKLKAPLLIISAQSYEGHDRGALAFNVSFTKPMESPILLIDDICDSGATMQNVYKYITSIGIEASVATLFYKERSSFKPDWYLNKVENETWIYFPWE